MRVLLDTHTFLWHIWDRPERSEVCKQVIANPQNELVISVGSCWEMAIKHCLGRLGVTMPFEQFLEEATRENEIAMLAISRSHLGRVASLPQHHRDPFDRLIVAQALAEAMPVVSRDEALDAYGVQRLW